MIMEITLLIMEKSWKNHGILFLNFCGNPDINIINLLNILSECEGQVSKKERVHLIEHFMQEMVSQLALENTL